MYANGNAMDSKFACTLPNSTRICWSVTQIYVIEITKQDFIIMDTPIWIESISGDDQTGTTVSQVVRRCSRYYLPMNIVKIVRTQGPTQPEGPS